MAVIVGQGISVSPVPDAKLSHESTGTVQNKVVADAIASEYSTSKTYSVGDVCTYDGKLYECIVDIPTAEGWTLAHWKVSNLGDVASDLSRQLNDETTGLDTKAPVILETTSGAIASFDDGAESMSIRKIVATIEPVQEGTGDPSPDNVRPISGWTGANIVGAGRNLAVGAAIRDVVFASVPEGRRGYNAETGWLWFQPQQGSGYPTIIGANSPNSISKIIFKAATQYTIIFEVTSQDDANDLNIAVSYTDGTTYAFKSAEKVSGKIIYTTPAGKTLKNIYIGYYVNKWTSINCNTFGVYEGVVTADGQQEQGTNLPINWQSEAGTVYGGTVTLNEDGSADVVATHAIFEVDIDTPIKTTRTNNSGNYQVAYTIPSTQYSTGITAANAICNALTVWPSSNVYNSQGPSSISIHYDSQVLYIAPPAGITTRADYLTWLSSLGTIQFLYNLRSGLYKTYHFDNVGQLKTFLGTNNVWIDTGAITECDYPADTKLYIDGITAPDEDMIANDVIASGKYFVVNNQLYLSTAAIAKGAQIIPGTNCTATNLAEALNAINA